MTHRITQYKVPGKLFESPVWDDQRDCLWCVDIKGGKLHALNLEGLVASYDFQGEPSAIFLTSQPENLLVAAGSVF
jgi:sugar lactone lactonase YvrE